MSPAVVLPVLDEAQALPWVLARMPPGYTPLVVDNGSSDGSAQIATALGARVVHEPQRGFGAACYAGLLAAQDDVVTCGLADLALGARCAARGAMASHARLANRVLTLELRRRSGVALRDLGPMRAARRGALLELGIADRRFGWPLEMVLRAAADQWRIVEVDVPYRARVGRSKVTGTVRGTARAMRDMLVALS
jgi:glycosyltransferase involved in cell wall biosynthesis